MGRRLDELQFDATYYPLAAFSCGFFLYCFKNVSPKWSSKLCPGYNLLNRVEQLDWNNRVGSSVHAVMISVVCSYTLAYNDDIAEDPIWWDSPTVRSTCAVVAGYMACDAVILVKHYRDLGDPFYMVHHAATIYAYYYVTTYGVLPYFANYRLMAEFSTIFVNQRWFMIALGYPRDNKLFVTNGVVLAGVFFSARIATLPFYWGQVYRVYNTPSFNKLGHIQLGLIIPCIALDVMNIYWFYKIMLGVFKVLKYIATNSATDPKVTQEKQPSNTVLNGNSFSSIQTPVPSIDTNHKHID